MAALQENAIVIRACLVGCVLSLAMSFAVIASKVSSSCEELLKSSVSGHWRSLSRTWTCPLLSTAGFILAGLHGRV